MEHLIRSSSKKITDPAGREMETLEDSQALRIAEEWRATVHDVYVAALRLGIYPRRYIRNRDTVSPEEQHRLAMSRVAVVGVGGLGGQVILLLARIGVGRIVVVDYDRFDETNLNRQALSSMGSIGKSKAEEAVRVVGSINPGVIVNPREVKIDPSNAVELLKGSDVVVDALDNIPARFVVEDAARSLGIPMVHGALAGLEGQLMTVFPEDPGIKRLYGTVPGEVDKSKSPEAILGVPTLMPSFIATLQATEVVKIILGRGRLLRDVMVHVDLEEGKMMEFALLSTQSPE
ncbi:MAG: HesA/MoeB/ThiF family protein [Deltaproteobacteria bacterium]|nr:HesA/MoeB/ThiF family protein [Deltaproteobacteria bacterium]MBW2352531.1 HesA/MoeB/ThiF family protein [Deltaproteobacteria bacterium]